MSTTDPNTAPRTPLPLQFWPVTVIVCIQLCESLQVNVLFPYLAFMIEDYGVPPDQIGFYAGWLAASFCFSQFLSSYLWGWYSDTYGRKPAILLGTVGTKSFYISLSYPTPLLLPVNS